MKPITEEYKQEHYAPCRQQMAYVEYDRDNGTQKFQRTRHRKAFTEKAAVSLLLE